MIGVAVWFFVFWCPAKEVTYCNYEKLKIGMTLEQAEAILGKPGREMPANELPRGGGGVPVIQGDKFFEWKGSQNGIKVFIGVKDGRICDMYYNEHSL